MAGGRGWPAGLSRPLDDAGHLLRYAICESACAIAGPCPELEGRAVPVSLLDQAERGACPDVVLRVGAPPSLQGAAPELVLAPPAICRAQSFTIQPSGDRPLLAFPDGTGPPSLLAALQAFFRVEAVPRGTSRRRAEVPSPGPVTQTLGLKLEVNGDDEYLLS